MRKHIMFVAFLFLLAGCSSAPEPTADTDPVADISANFPGNTKVIAPIILGENETTAQVVAGYDMVVFALPDPSSWTASISPAELAVFQAGSDDSMMVTNPGLHPLKEGVVTVELTNNTGRTLSYTITITAPPVETSTDLLADPAAATETFGFTVLGMLEVEAIAAIESSGRVARVAERDGEGLMLTKDYNPSRLNIIIISGIVSSVYVG